MIRVSVALASRSAEGCSISSLTLNEWMGELRAMPYRYSKHWQTPAEVDDAQVSDCKGKALVLYAKMRENGATNVRLVIGKHHVYDSATHAWLEWATTAGTYLLDPTFSEAPVKTAELDPMIYIPFYAYDGIRKYRASNAGFAVPMTRLASGVANQTLTSPVSSANSAAPALAPASFPTAMTRIPVLGDAVSPAMGRTMPRSFATPYPRYYRKQKAGVRLVQEPPAFR